MTSAPDGCAVWNWRAPPDILMALMADEEGLREDRITWSDVDGSERTVILSHVPGKYWATRSTEIYGPPRSPVHT